MRLALPIPYHTLPYCDIPYRNIPYRNIPISYQTSVVVAAFFGMIPRSSSRGGDLRPAGVGDPAAGRAGSTIIMPSPPELEMVRSHNSQLVPGVAPNHAYVPTPLGSMGSLAQAVINRVRGARGAGDSPGAESGRRSFSLLSRGVFRRDSCPSTPLAGVGSNQDASSSYGMVLACHGLHDVVILLEAHQQMLLPLLR